MNSGSLAKRSRIFQRAPSSTTRITDESQNSTRLLPRLFATCVGQLEATNRSGEGGCQLGANCDVSRHMGGHFGQETLAPRNLWIFFYHTTLIGVHVYKQRIFTYLIVTGACSHMLCVARSSNAKTTRATHKSTLADQGTGYFPL